LLLTAACSADNDSLRVQVTRTIADRYGTSLECVQEAVGKMSGDDLQQISELLTAESDGHFRDITIDHPERFASAMDCPMRDETSHN
jgi:hypothetical protein